MKHYQVTCRHQRIARFRFWAARQSFRLMLWLISKMLLHVIPKHHPSAIMLRGLLDPKTIEMWMTALGPRAAVATLGTSKKY